MIAKAMIFATSALLTMPVVRLWNFNFGVGDMFLCATLGILALSGRLRGLRTVRNERRWFVSGFLLLVGFILSDLVNGGQADTKGLFTLAQYAAVIILIPFLYLGAPHSKAAVFGYLAGIIANVVVATLAWNYGWLVPGTIAGRYSGLFGNPNALAKNLAVPAILFLDLGIRSRNVPRWIAYGGVLMCGLGGILAASFGGILAISIGVVAYLALIGKRGVLYGFGLLALLAYLLFATEILSGFSEKLDERIENARLYSSVRELGSFERKIGLMHESILTILSNPIVGRGLQSYEGDVDSEYEWNVVHNWELIVYETGGILSFVGALGMLLYLLVSVRSRAFLCRPETRAVAYASMAVFFLNAQTNTHMFPRFWWIAPFLVLRMVKDEAMRSRIPREGSRRSSVNGRDIDSRSRNTADPHTRETATRRCPARSRRQIRYDG